MLEQLVELGYTYQLPLGRDNTLYLVKQEKDLTKQIYVEYNKKKATIYAYNIDYIEKTGATLTTKELDAITNYLLDNGVSEYEVVEYDPDLKAYEEE